MYDSFYFASTVAERRNHCLADRGSVMRDSDRTDKCISAKRKYRRRKQIVAMNIDVGLVAEAQHREEEMQRLLADHEFIDVKSDGRPLPRATHGTGQ